MPPRSEGTCRHLIAGLVLAIVSLCGGPVAPQGLDLLVGSGSTDKVLRYDGQTGDFIGTFVAARSGGLVIPAGLALGSDGNLYVGAMSDSQVLRYDGLTGAFLNVFVVGGSGGLIVPIGLVFGPDGHPYVSSSADDQVLRYDGQTGAFLDAFVAAGSGGLNRPLFLIFTPSPPPILGSILVRGLPLVGATVTFGQGSTQTTTTDAKGCYTFETADVSEQGTVNISVPAQP